MTELKFQIKLDTIVLSEAEAATRIPICMVGTFFKGKQKFTITRDDVATMAENFLKRGNGEVVMDYEHAAEFPELAAGGPVPAAGWIQSVDAEPDSDRVVWGDVKFTERAAAMLKAHEYKFGSPVLKWGVIDKSTGKPQGMTLTSYALTNTPLLDQMPAIRLSEAAGKEEQNNVAKNEAMCSEHTKTPLLCPKCDADEIKTLAGSERGHQHEGPKVLQLSEVTRDARGVIDLNSVAASDGAVSVAVVLAMQNQQLALSEVAEAVKAGKVTPAQRPYYEKMALSDRAGFGELVKTMKPVVDLGERGHGGGGEGIGDLSEVEKIDAEMRALAEAKAKENGIGYGQALKLVASEKPELTRRRTNLMRKRTKIGDAEEGSES